MKRCEGGLSAGAVGVRWAKWCGSCGGALGEMYIYIPNYFFTVVGVYFLTEYGKHLSVYKSASCKMKNSSYRIVEISMI